MEGKLKQFSNPISTDSGNSTADRLRAIDALIAEHLFGWSRMYRMKNVHGYGGWPPGRHMAPQVPPNYSFDPAASKQARDKMRELGWKDRICWNGTEVTATVQRGHANDNWGFGEAEADTDELAYALAICAALKIEVAR